MTVSLKKVTIFALCKPNQQTRNAYFIIRLWWQGTCSCLEIISKCLDKPSLSSLPEIPVLQNAVSMLILNLTDFDAIGKFCIKEKIEVVVVGPEEPLVKGIYDYFKSDENLKEIHFIGPSKNAAQLEGSKAFAKAFMQRHNIPTAAYKEFTLDNYEEGVKYLEAHSLPIVLKADGLAGGKGVVICQSHVEAIAEFELMIQESKFGDASKKVVVEDFLEGIEMSVFILTDGKSYLLLPEAKDYKRIGKGRYRIKYRRNGSCKPGTFCNAGIYA